MSIAGGPDTIQDGLVLSLDAADKNSYVGSGTAWTDLSGNSNNGTLTNGPTFSSVNQGSIVFDGVDDYAATSYAPTFNDFTVITWFKSTNVVSYSRVVDKNYATGMWIGRNSNTANSWGGGVLEGSAPYGRFVSLVDGSWHMITSIRQGTTHTIYGDGIASSTSGTVSSNALSATSFTFGINPAFGALSDPFGGNIASVKIYNRALSASEVAQNYNSTKTRFGL
jgi:hypothetical protein